MDILTLIESAFGGQPNVARPATGFHSADGVDVSMQQLDNPEVVDRLNMFLSALSDKPVWNPYYDLVYLQTKFSMIGFTFDSPALSGDSGSQVCKLKRGGQTNGIVNKEGEVGTDSNCNWGIKFDWSKHKGRYTISAVLVPVEKDTDVKKPYTGPKIATAPKPAPHIKEDQDFLAEGGLTRLLRSEKPASHPGHAPAIEHGFEHKESVGNKYDAHTVHSHVYEHSNGRKLVLDHAIPKDKEKPERHDFLFTKGPSHRRWLVHGSFHEESGVNDFHTELKANNETK